MRTKSLLLVATLAVPTTAFTFGFGGWALTTVEDVPEYGVAGRPFDITYTVRHHGQGLTPGLSGKVTVASGGRTAEFPAMSLGEGLYRTRVTIAEPGTWDIRVNNGFSPLGGNMLPLKVVAASAPAPAPLSPYERGHQLYVAKGCATCHAHQQTQKLTTIKLGPDLSEPKFASAYLARFLADPSIKKDWKTEWRMPNLGLKPAEVTALVAFLNQEKK